LGVSTGVSVILGGGIAQITGSVVMKLTGTKVAEAKPADRERKLSDGGGLYLLVKPKGTKAWRYKYRINGRELTLALGVYPEISLKLARRGGTVATPRTTGLWLAVRMKPRKPG
jgi:hypothetical protein